MKRDAQTQRALSYGIPAFLGLSILVGVGKMYFDWRRWKIDYNREKMPWDRIA